MRWQLWAAALTLAAVCGVPAGAQQSGRPAPVPTMDEPQPAAQADARWDQVFAYSTQVWSVDRTRVHRVGPHRYRYWARLVFQSIGDLEPGDGPAWAVFNQETDCDALRTKRLQYAGYDRAGAVVESQVFDAPKWEGAIPGTQEEALTREICAVLPGFAKRG